MKLDFGKSGAKKKKLHDTEYSIGWITSFNNSIRKKLIKLKKKKTLGN